MSGLDLALLVILGAVVYLDEWPALQTMVSRPIVVGVVVGLILDAPAQGAFWGALFEAIHLAFLPVGAARVPSAGLSALVGTAVAITTDALAPAPAALALAVGMVAGEVGEAADHLQRRWNGRTAERVRVAVAAGDPGAPGRGVAVALVRAAAVGALRTGVALALGLGVAWLLGGGPWTAGVSRETLRLTVAAAAAVAGLQLFRARGTATAAWGAGVGAGALLAWLGAGA